MIQDINNENSRLIPNRRSREENSFAFDAAATTGAFENAPTTADKQEVSECHSCPRITSRRCSMCGRDFYCSQWCEDRRSGSHVFTCAKHSLISADYLYHSLRVDTLPDDEDVRDDFGFNQLVSFADQRNLLGLYQRLYLSGKVTEDDIHKWQVEGTLVSNIKVFFYQIPEEHRGGYFPWFLKHEHILDRHSNKKRNSRGSSGDILRSSAIISG